MKSKNNQLVTHETHNCGEFISLESKTMQERITLDALRNGPVTTIQLRDEHGILHPPGRIWSLRRQGYPIHTMKVYQNDQFGRLHPVAMYRLESTNHA